MTFPEHENPSLIPAFIQELAALFAQQTLEATEALHQNYAVHAKHLAYLEQALVFIQRDQPEEAKAALLMFSTKEEARSKEQARLLVILGRQERSPHAERQERLLHQLTAALPSSDQPDEAQE